MWIGLIQLASLIVLAVIGWYAKETSLSLVRLLAFLDARDIEYRKDRTDDARARAARIHSIDTWLRDTRAIWGKLFSATERLRAIGEELVAPDRKTVEMRLPPGATAAPPADHSADLSAPVPPRPDPALPPDLAELARRMDAAAPNGNRDSDAPTQIMDKALAVQALHAATEPQSLRDVPETTPKPGTAPASRKRLSPTACYRASPGPPWSESVLSAAPAQAAAGIGPRPLPASTRPASMVSTRRPPPITVADPPSAGVPSRRATVMGLQPLSDEEPERLSWEALKREGMIGSTVRPNAAAPVRFPGTMMSMQAVTEPGSAPSSPARPIAPIEAKEVCRECDGGFVRVGNGGIRKCRACDGSGFVNVQSP
jgi:hypothetical protein